MCNAFNHPPNCNCGWGGVWYGSTSDSDTWLFNRPLHHPRKLGRQNGTYQAISRGYTRPNSKCPVCGQSVYFYASPYGGRVFFDDLGPPWPKHPCTDNAGPGTPRNTESQTKTSAGALLWLADVHLAKVATHTYEMQGVSGTKKYIFHFDAPETVMAEMVRFRPLQHGNIELHILDYNDEKRCWVAWQGIARVKRDSSESANKLQASVVHQHESKTLLVVGTNGLIYRRPIPDHSRPLTAMSTNERSSRGELRITGDGFYLCPKCGAHLTRGRVLDHLVKMHKVHESDLSQLSFLPAYEMTRPVACPECSNKMPLQHLGPHRRRKHGVSK